MLITLSPAKTLDFDTPRPTSVHSRPELLRDSGKLIGRLRELTPKDLQRLMKLSPTLAELNCGRYADYKQRYDARCARQAIAAFKGDVYVGLGADDFTPEDYDYAQAHLRILSGLYGVLRPLDLIQPHRLEMGTRLSTERGNDLYAFWGDTITDTLKTAFNGDSDRTLINLASNEYFKAVRGRRLDARIITPVFRDWKNGTYKTISFYAKKARGMLTRYAVDERITDPEDLKGFTEGGYKYSAKLSDGDTWVFTRR